MKQVKWKVGLMSLLLSLSLGSTVAGAEEGSSFLLTPVKEIEQSTGFYRDKVAGGEEKNYVFYLSNLTNKPLDLWVYPADARPGVNGGKMFSTRGDYLNSVGSWAEPNGSYKVALKAREKKKLSYDFTIPKDLKAGQYVGVVAAEEVKDEILNSGTTEKDKTTLLIEKIQRIGVQVVFEKDVDKATHSMSIDGFKHSYIANGYSQLTVKLSNNGTILERPSGFIRVKDSKGIEMFSEEYDASAMEGSIYGSTTADMVYTVQDKVLWPGEYTAYYEATYSGETISKEFKFTVTQKEANKSLEELTNAGVIAGGGLLEWIKSHLWLTIIIIFILIIFIVGFFFLLFLLLKRKKKEDEERRRVRRVTRR
ncbi:hypothetical protein [Paenibacillus gallinarum]|uniref:DUF3324 domain-containing protein n=1 Tax=Paenibacillus gallinarum TaxID=2762232 RepID=A0ABR8T3E5_9BACL|nr:hypothetical protein [Paenibacillus gallinarum]MBD7970277.1 hypothetical protein [Paenibacillus gallinarum]